MIEKIAQREGDNISLPVEELIALRNACSLIEKYNFLDKVIKLFKIGLLSPLTLKDDEFEDKKSEDGFYYNKRYPSIIKTVCNKIINLYPYDLYVRAKYNHNTLSQEEYIPKPIRISERVYISKGGVITGEYFENCVIKDSIINNHNFEINQIPCIPVCVVTKKDNSYFVVDHREPKIKELQKIYDLAICVDERVKSSNMNLRKYKKLNK